MELIVARPYALEQEQLLRIADCLKRGRRALVLVPPQDTLHTELRLMEGLGLSGSFELDVVSPGRLRERVFERAGSPERIVFDARGKRMILTAILCEAKGQLRYYARAAEHGGEALADRLAEVIGAFRQAGRTPEQLRAQAEAVGGVLGEKLSEVALLYARYLERIEGKLMDQEDLLAEELRRLPSSGLIAGREVFILGFDRITPGFADEILMIAGVAPQTTLFVESDRNAAPDGRLFAPVNASLALLQKRAGARGIALKETRLPGLPERPIGLAALQPDLFALSPERQSAAPQEICVRAASSPVREVHLAAGEMRRLMLGGMQPSEMAAFYPAGDRYPALMLAILPLYGVPVFAAERRPASGHPLIHFLLSALRATEESGIRMGEMIECVSSGFMGVGEEEGAALIAYCEQMGIRAGSFVQPFRYKLGPEMADEALEAVERTRAAVCETLLSLQSALREAQSPDAVILAVLGVLEKIGARDKLEQMGKILNEAGMESEAQTGAQLWNALMEVLDQLHALLEAGTPPQVTRRLLEGGLAAMELSALPRTGGVVLCGEVGNLRAGEVRAAFLLGMNDGEHAGETALFTPEERAKVETDGVIFGLTEEEREAVDTLDLLKAACGAKERLFVSYALADEMGAALREGRLIPALRRLYPALPVQGGAQEEELDAMLCAPAPAAEAIALRIRGEEELPPAYGAAAAWLASDEKGREALEAIAGKLRPPLPLRLPAQKARALYRTLDTMSVSRLETYAACPFRYYVRYGLRPTEARAQGVDRQQLGTLYHAAAEGFLSAARREPDFPNLPEATTQRLMDEATAELLQAWRASPFGESRRGEAAARRIQRTAGRVAKTILRQLGEGAFRPEAMELGFGMGDLPPLCIELADGERLLLKGRIDRVDIWAEGRALRIIDYKSGSKEFDATRVYYGLQLQLLLYLSAALRAFPGLRAGGLFYLRMADPTIATDSRVKEEVEAQIAEKLKLAGLCLGEVELLRAMDARHRRMIGANGAQRWGKGETVSAAQMQGLIDYAGKKAASLAQEAHSGAIPISPYRMAGAAEEACTYCAYRAICGIDPATRRRKLAKQSLDAFEKLSEN